jgi:hypothetical protein
VIDPDEIARRAAASLHARAGDVAATEDALSRLVAGQPQQPRASARSTRRWWLAAGAAAVVASLVIGVIAIRAARDDSDQRLIDAPPPTDSVPPSIDPATTVPSITTTPEPPPSSVVTDVPQTTTTVATAQQPTALTNGLTITPPTAGWVVTRSLDRQLGYGDAARAETITDLQLTDRSIVRVVLTDVEPDWPRREAAVIGGRDGWTASLRTDDNCQSCWTLYGSVVSGVARLLDDDTWLLVESTPGEASLNVPDQLPVVAAQVLLQLAESATYDPTSDRRVAARATTDAFAFAGPQCGDSTATVTGAPGAPDFALFTCDGALAVYDGETGERIRLIEKFTPPGDPVDPNAEGSGPAYVDGIAVSPDGQTLYHSEGPEPISGVTYATDLAGPAAPELGRAGWWPATDSTGRYLAASAVDTVIIHDLTDGTSRSIPMEGGQVAGPKAFSPDGRTLAVEMSGGTIAIIDLETTNVALLANVNPQVQYHQPHYTQLGLEVITTCCTGGAGDEVSDAINPGLDGTVSEGGGGDGSIVTPYRLVSGGGVRMELRGTDLVFDGRVIATGVLETAILPPG